MDALLDFLGALGGSVLLIMLVAAHILEEALMGFRRFFNLEWFKTGRDDFPTSRLKAILVDQLGLFLALSMLALLGTVSSPAMYAVVGFIAADVVQHVTFSVVRRKYSPGVATSVLYFLFVIAFLRGDSVRLDTSTLVAMIVGAAALAGNYGLAWMRVRRWRQQTVAV
jgi:hypothetical protein